MAYDRSLKCSAVERNILNLKMDVGCFDLNRNTSDRFRLYYPNVNEDETPLPRSWSSQEKCNSIGLTQNNLRCHYKGIGKSHNDAASVRTPYPIPAACGLYYFEVKIISKGRDGYMGIGLTAQNFKMNRLPGWDKQSYGYHGDDGNSFCSSGNGQPYGPTFTTGDVIGCGVNLVDNTCFYTKNGHHLGIAFRELPAKLFPTVGLQTPGEVVDANFGQEPFKFDIEDMFRELRAATQSSIYSFSLPDNHRDWMTTLHKMVSSYLVHHGYSATAETFGKTTGQNFREDIPSIQNRQKISNLVISGRMGLAIEHTLISYPGLLENNQKLFFLLKCRQFIEMVNGSDFEVCSARLSPVQTSVIQSTKLYQRNGSNVKESSSDTNNQLLSDTDYFDFSNDIEMENGSVINDCSPSKKSGKSGVERMLEFGRELFQMSQKLEKDFGLNEANQKALEDAFSLLAYSNPWSSPLGWQLCPSRREPVCAALNSAILESLDYSWRSPLEVCIAHACELLRLMACSSLGSCAFASIDDILQSAY